MVSNFKTTIYGFTSNIPRGRVATYGQLARMAGHPKASRVVGILMKHNPSIPLIPCHRVVASDGSLTGYSGIGGLIAKKRLLMNEGVLFVGEKVNLNLCLWRP